jgi:hypothetical protein
VRLRRPGTVLQPLSLLWCFDCWLAQLSAHLVSAGFLLILLLRRCCVCFAKVSMSVPFVALLLFCSTLWFSYSSLVWLCFLLLPYTHKKGVRQLKPGSAQRRYRTYARVVVFVLCRKFLRAVMTPATPRRWRQPLGVVAAPPTQNAEDTYATYLFTNWCC